MTHLIGIPFGALAALVAIVVSLAAIIVRLSEGRWPSKPGDWDGGISTAFIVLVYFAAGVAAIVAIYFGVTGGHL